MATGRHCHSRTRLGAAAVALAALAAAGTYGFTGSAGPAQAAGGCTPYQSIDLWAGTG